MSSYFSSLRWADDPVAQALVCFERRDLHVVQGKAGFSQVRLAVQERWRDVHSVPQELGKMRWSSFETLNSCISRTTVRRN